MDNDTTNLLSNVEATLMEDRLHQAFELCIQAGRFSIDDSDQLLIVGQRLATVGHQSYLKEQFQLALNAYWIASMLIPDRTLDESTSAPEELLEQRSITFMIGRCYMQLKKWDEAIAALESLADNPPWGQEYQLYETLGELYYSLGRYEEGIDTWKRGLTYCKDSGFGLDNLEDQARTRIAWAYQKLGKMPELLTFLKRKFEDSFSETGNYEAWYDDYITLAKSFGIEDYKNSLQSVINYYFVNYGEGETFLKSREKPSWFVLDAASRLANIHIADKNYSEAEKILTIVLTWDKKYALACLLFARLCLRRHDIKRATNYLDKVISNSPDTATLKFDVEADLLLQKDEYDNALKAAEAGIKLVRQLKEESLLNPQYWDDLLASLYLRKIDALVKLEQNDRAIEELDIASEEFPKVETFYLYSALLNYFSGQPEDALTVLERAEKENVSKTEKFKQIRDKVLLELGR